MSKPVVHFMHRTWGDAQRAGWGYCGGLYGCKNANPFYGRFRSRLSQAPSCTSDTGRVTCPRCLDNMAKGVEKILRERPRRSKRKG